VIRALRIFLLICLVTPAGLSAAPRSLQEDCVICGHACCCPEMCAPKIAELKALKKAQSCGSASATCRFGVDESHEARLEVTQVPAPVRALAWVGRPVLPERSEPVLQGRFTRTKTIQMPPPTPPPRFAA